MNRPCSRDRGARLAALGLILLLGGTALPAAALDAGSYSVEVLVNGIAVEELPARGTTYVEAREGEEYSIRLTNRTARRVAVALAVDGLNTIDAKRTTARDAAKWILGPYESLVVAGWQTSAADARRFFFTTEDRSYGAWLGQAANLGNISAVFFRERRVDPDPIYRPQSLDRGRSPSSGEADAPGRADAAPPAERPSGKKSVQREGAAEMSTTDDLAATGIGRRIDHRVRRVRFVAEDNPAAALELRYEYRDALVRLGVLPRPYARRDPLQRRERSTGFDHFEFAPDPHR